MMRRVLVVGAAGFIGQHLVRALGEANIEVVAQVHYRSATFGAHVVDVATTAVDASTLNVCDAVVWLAAATTPASSALNPMLELTNNLAPLLALLQNMRSSCHLVYVSSGGTVYGDVERPADETMPLHPRSYYGAGKAASEHFIEAWCRQHGGSATVLRPSNVYGPGQSLHGGFGVIPAAMDCIRQGKPMTLWGGGSSLRDYLYIDDFISACVAALRRPSQGTCRVLNICSGEATRLSEMLEQIERVARKVLLRDPRPARAVDLHSVLLDGGRARCELDWTPQTSLPEGLRKTWQWFLTSGA